MRLIMTAFFFVGSLIFLSGCVEDLLESEYDAIADRTILVYMIAEDNNLSAYSKPNIISMSEGMSRKYSQNNNLIVYLDQRNQLPVLLRVHDYSVDTIMIFQEEYNSTDPRIFSKVIELTIQKYPADSYGLILWSHGSGWLYQNTHRYVAPSSLRIQNRDSFSNSGGSYNSSELPYAYTKAFGYEPDSNTWMDIDDMVSVIPDSVFDYILFDACFMGSVETLYSLRNKAEKIISSPYEIVSSGFPYKTIIPQLLNDDLLGVCNSFYHFYDTKTSWERTAGVSIIETSELDNLAMCFKKIVSGKKEIISTFNINSVQRFDRFSNHVMFDLLNFVQSISDNSDDLNEFIEQLSRCIPLALSTKSILEDIEVRAFCGLSVYIPISRYDLVNGYYKSTEWSINTGYGQ